MNRFLHGIITGRNAGELLIALSLLEIVTFVPASGDTSSPTGPTLTTACSSLTTNTSGFISERSGTILFNCNGKAALTIARAGKFEAVLSLPPGYIGLTIVPHTVGTSTCAPGLTLASGTIFSFTGPGNFDCCALYSNYPVTGLSSFSLTWNKK